ncbi:MAG: hypothetical protein EBZ62_00270 [Sphingobacteriia bacterium]|nr:hypothetical protein [Sphingobacteriia bacterium]
MYFLKLIQQFFPFKKEIINKENSISFIVDESSRVKIKIIINDVSLKSSNNFGFLLYLINSGYYTKSALDSLVELSKEHPNYESFIEHTIHSWSQNLDIKPIISPSNFCAINGINK